MHDDDQTYELHKIIIDLSRCAKEIQYIPKYIILKSLLPMYLWYSKGFTISI